MRHVELCFNLRVKLEDLDGIWIKKETAFLGQALASPVTQEVDVAEEVEDSLEACLAVSIRYIIVVFPRDCLIV